MGKAEYKVTGGKLIKVQLIAEGNIIEKIKVTGDFFLHPEEFIEEIEKALKGCMLDEQELAALIKGLMEKKDVTLLGATPEDFAKCIMMAGEKNG